MVDPPRTRPPVRRRRRSRGLGLAWIAIAIVLPAGGWGLGGFGRSPRHPRAGTTVSTPRLAARTRSASAQLRRYRPVPPLLDPSNVYAADGAGKFSAAV